MTESHARAWATRSGWIPSLTYDLNQLNPLISQPSGSVPSLTRESIQLDTSDDLLYVPTDLQEPWSAGIWKDFSMHNEFREFELIMDIVTAAAQPSGQLFGGMNVVLNLPYFFYEESDVDESLVEIRSLRPHIGNYITGVLYVSRGNLLWPLFGISDEVRVSEKLNAVFDAEPLEDGMEHPAERIIKNTLQTFEGENTLKFFEKLSFDLERPSFSASVLRCLSRQENIGSSPWRASLVKTGLTIDNVEIRDAAIQAAESWGGQATIDILKSHRDSEPWLQDYIQDVINDLES